VLGDEHRPPIIARYSKCNHHLTSKGTNNKRTENIDLSQLVIQASLPTSKSSKFSTLNMVVITFYIIVMLSGICEHPDSGLLFDMDTFDMSQLWLINYPASSVALFQSAMSEAYIKHLYNSMDPKLDCLGCVWF
jgi:hypothetical protein